MAALMSGFLQTWFFIASFIPWFLIDRIGRRPLLLSMISVMAAVMAVQAALIFQVQNNTSVAKSAGIAAAAMLFVFQGAFTIGFQATVWVYPSEILPLRLRQRGSSISTAANWICNYVSALRQSVFQTEANGSIDHRPDHTSCHQQHWLAHIHHLCRPQRDLGSHYLPVLP
jgi:MFS family permease